jgi:hypothetical protein
MYVQTGDVLYKSVDSFPMLRKKVAGNLIHKGQNHHHTIKGKFALTEKDGTMFIEAKADCKLEHEEHATIVLPKGKYKKDIVVEYDHFLEESRQVID